jgi:2'-phosphotransferase
MRSSANVLVFVDVAKALEADITFHLSDNGVILTEGDQNGILLPQFFLRVEDSKGVVLPGWEESRVA